jgi:hypothetical protein
MNGKRIIQFIWVSVLLASPVVSAQKAPPAYPPGQPPSLKQGPTSEQTDMKTFSGKISRNIGKYVLEDLIEKTSYILDDQKSAKKYEGKTVVITGTLDSLSNIIHIQKIATAVLD